MPNIAEDERAQAAAVRQMFTSIAPRYDLLNHLLSFNVDRLWWRRAARTFAHILGQKDTRVLDLCCGTGDMTLALLREAQSQQSTPVILGVDFSHEMLIRGSAKFEVGEGTRSSLSIRWIEADALHLPFPDNSFQLVVSAFGFRNLANYISGLKEIHRVLAPGGEVGILDFGEPKGFVGFLYHIYFRSVLPVIGTCISGVRGPYSYLPASVRRFPLPEEMLVRMAIAGFRQPSWTAYTFGIAGLYWGIK